MHRLFSDATPLEKYVYFSNVNSNPTPLDYRNGVYLVKIILILFEGLLFAFPRRLLFDIKYEEPLKNLKTCRVPSLSQALSIFVEI
jgi:hypothetical protein